MNSHRVFQTVLASAGLLTLVGCAGLPSKDAAPALATAQSSDFVRAGTGTQASGFWWRRLEDPQLQELIALAQKGSPTLELAKVRIAQAAAVTGRIEATTGVSLAVDGQLTHQRYSENFVYPPPVGGSTHTNALAQLNFSYDFDFWGRNHSALEASLGREAAAHAELEASASTLAASVAKTYFQWQALGQRLQVLDSLEQCRRELAALEQRRAEAGLTPADTVQPLLADAAAPRQTRAQVETLREQALAQLRFLLGASALPTLTPAPLPELSGGLPDTAHLDLLASRPDLAAARDRVLASLKEVDSSRAAFYPNITLSSFVGLSSLEVDKFIDAGSRGFGLTPALHLPLFDSGRLRAGLAQSRVEVTVAAAQYTLALRQAVLEVNDSALRLEGLERERAPLVRQVEARTRASKAAEQRYSAGLTDRRELVRSRLGLLALQDLELLRHASAVQAQVDLLRAVGGLRQDDAKP